MTAANIVNKLYAFQTVDKYEAFKKIQPNIVFTEKACKTIVTAILDECCRELIRLFESNKKPTKISLTQSVTKCMNNIMKADINTENRDFGYDLCWYLAETAGLNLKQSSGNKIWGYWEIDANEVKPVNPSKGRKRKE